MAFSIAIAYGFATLTESHTRKVYDFILRTGRTLPVTSNRKPADK
jgi:hypothetical protein